MMLWETPEQSQSPASIYVAFSGKLIVFPVKLAVGTDAAEKWGLTGANNRWVCLDSLEQGGTSMKKVLLSSHGQ